jgi:hypothetical protein
VVEIGQLELTLTSLSQPFGGIPETPFSAAFRTTSRNNPPPPQPSLPVALTSSLLIDFAPTPRAPKHLLLPSTITRARTAPPIYFPPTASTVRHPSPLKQVLNQQFDSSADLSRDEAPFTMESPPATARRGGFDWEDEGTPVRPMGGKKWAVVSKLREEKRRARSRSVSPVKDLSPSSDGALICPLKKRRWGFNGTMVCRGQLGLSFVRCRRLFSPHGRRRLLSHRPIAGRRYVDQLRCQPVRDWRRR